MPNNSKGTQRVRVKVQKSRAKEPKKVEIKTNEAVIEMFLAHYIETGSATLAAKHVRPDIESPKVWGHRLLQMPSVQLQLARKREAITAGIEWRVADSLRELVGVAMTDPIQAVIDVTAEVDASNDSAHEWWSQIPEDVRRCIKKISFMQVQKKEFEQELAIKAVEFYDRLAAIDMLNKHKGFYEADNSQKGDAVALLLASLQAKNSGAKLAVKH